MITPGPGELRRVMEAYLLPDLPGADESLDSSTDDYAAAPRDLILFRENDDNILLREYVPLEDAKEYCEREAARGDGWFVGFDRTCLAHGRLTATWQLGGRVLTSGTGTGARAWRTS